MLYEYCREGDLGVFTVRGRKDLESSIGFWKRVRQAIDDDGLRSVLGIDHTEQESVPFEVIELVHLFGRISFPKDIPIAIVVPEWGSGLDNNRLGSKMAGSLGWKLIEVFTDERDARSWIARNVSPKVDA